MPAVEACLPYFGGSVAIASRDPADYRATPGVGEADGTAVLSFIAPGLQSHT